MVRLNRIAGVALALMPLTAAMAQFDGPAPLAWRWAQMTTAPPLGTPIASNDRVFVAVGSRIYGLEKETGNQVWRYPVGEPLDGVFRTGAVYADGVVIANADNRGVYAVDAQTGALRWRFNSPDILVGPPVVTDGVVVYAVQGGDLHALDLATGAPRWEAGFRLSSGLIGTMAVWQNLVIVFTNDDHMTAIDVRTQRPAWRTRFSRLSPTVKAAVFGDSLFVNSGTFVSAVRAATGRARWQQNVLEDLMFAPAVAPEGVVVVSREGKAFSFDVNGRPIFRRGIELDSTPVASPSFVGSMVVVPTANGALNLVNPMTGDITWNFVMPPVTTGAPAGGAMGGPPGLGGAPEMGGGGMPGLGAAGGMPGMGAAGGPPGGPGRGMGGGVGAFGAQPQQEIRFVTAAGPAIVSGTTLLVLARDGSLLAFDRVLGVDLTPPEVRMAWPNAGDQMSGRPPFDLIFRLEDIASGVNPESIQVTFDGQELVGELNPEGFYIIRVNDATVNRKILSAARQVGDGRKVIVVTVADWLGNVTTQRFAVTIDNSLPPLGGPRPRDPQGGLGGPPGGRGGGAGAGAQF